MGKDDLNPELVINPALQLIFLQLIYEKLAQIAGRSFKQHLRSCNIFQVKKGKLVSNKHVCKYVS